MTPMQHRAVLVCILCVLVVLLTFGITTTLLKKEEPAPPSRSLQRDPLPPAKTCRATTRSTTPPPLC